MSDAATSALPAQPLSDAELAKMKAQLVEVSPPQPMRHDNMCPISCDRCRWTDAFARYALAAPANMAALIGEVERLQREISDGIEYHGHWNDCEYCRARVFDEGYQIGH